MVEYGHIVLGGVRVPIRTIAIGWGVAVAVFGALAAIVAMTSDATFFANEDGVAGGAKIITIAVTLFVMALAGLAGFGLLGAGDREAVLGVGILAVTALAALLSAISTLVERAIPGDASWECSGSWRSSRACSGLRSGWLRVGASSGAPG